MLRVLCVLCVLCVKSPVSDLAKLKLYNRVPMKAYVYVSFKKSVLDPQGKTIHGALRKMGYPGVSDVRQGKYSR